MQQEFHIPFLHPGDEIRIIAPAKKINPEEVLPAIEFLNQHGFVVTTGKNLYKEDHQFAGSDKERKEDLEEALRDKNVKAILAARGGYGCLRLVDTIQWELLKEQPKWIMGYSDLTVFLNHLYAKFQLPALHCSMPINFMENTQESLNSILSAISGKGIQYEWENTGEGRNGTAAGTLIGGNLSILFAMMGSGSLPDPKGCILFLEDLDEYYYHLDRMMVALKRAGFLDGLKGVIIGGFTDLKDNAIPFGRNAEQIILEHVPKNIPVAVNMPAGHINDNRALVTGAWCKMEVTIDLQKIEQ